MKRFVVITIKTDPDTGDELKALCHTYAPSKSISEMGHIALRNGIKRIKEIQQGATEIGYTRF